MPIQDIVVQQLEKAPRRSVIDSRRHLTHRPELISDEVREHGRTASTNGVAE